MATSSESTWSDERIDQLLGNLLRTGVLLSMSIVLLAGVIYLWHHGGAARGTDGTDYGQFRGPQPAFCDSLSGIMASLRVPRWSGYIQLGVLLLIATPVARVVFSLITFAIQRDWIYVSVTLIVLAVLLYSMFGETP